MTERIYLNGSLMEREAGAKPLQLVYQSPILTEIDAIMSNRTNSVTFPLTDGNRKAIGYAAEMTDAEFPFRRHAAIYVRDGVQIFSGYGVLLSIGTDTFDMCFTWGNVSAFNAMKSLKLRSLQTTTTASDYCTLPPLSPYTDAAVTFGAGRKRPCITANTVLAKIETACGVSGLTTNGSEAGIFSRYVLPLTNKESDVNTKQSQAFQAYSGSYVLNGTYYQFAKKDNVPIYDPNETFVDNAFDVSDVSSVLFRVTGAVTICLLLRLNSTKYWPNNTAFACLQVMGKKSGHNDVALYTYYYYHTADAPENFVPPTQSWSDWCTLTLRWPVSTTLNVTDYDSIYISLMGTPASGTIEDIRFYNESGEWSNLYVCLSPTESEDVIYNSDQDAELFPLSVGKQYPIFKNLPDWTASEFVKQLMLLEGVFAYADSSTHITFVTVKDITDNKSAAIDWTDKLLTLTPTERTTVLDGTAEHNLCIYSGNDSRADSYIDSDDETLDAETDYIKSSFAASVGNAIAQYSEDEDGKVTEATITQRILRHPSADNTVSGAVFDGQLEWATLLARPAYTALATLMHRPHIVKATILCDVAALVNLDWLKPITLRQTGRYYAVRTITTGEDGTAEVELIQI